jgi:RNA polymerase sigma-70 factor, ECF subfamily
MITEQDDASLIKQVCAGKTQAFETLVLRYQRPLFYYLVRLAIEKAVIEELVQETFIRAYQNLKHYDARKGASFATWLFTIARRLALNELETARRRYEIQGTDDLLEEIDENLSPAETKELLERQAALYQALNELAMPFRSAVSLAYLEELSLKEIANIEECSIGTVKSRIFRGKMKLKALLSKTLEIES